MKLSEIINKLRIAGFVLAATVLTGCSDSLRDGSAPEGNGGVIVLSGEIEQEFMTRASDAGFADGDRIGVYIVDYEGNEPGVLKSNGNRADNARHTFEEQTWRWVSDYDIYWKDKTTRIDVYGYYPFGSPDDVNAYHIEVSANQNIEASEGKMGAYEASDFLWGKAGGISPQQSVVRVSMNHRLANARITLVKGEGFADGEWAELRKEVVVSNTRRNATVDLATGAVAATGKAEGSIVPSKRGDEYRAIVVPQTVASGNVLFDISVDGRPYKFSKSDDFEYAAGKMNNFTIRVDKKDDKGDYVLTLVGESITPWENDLVSHDATAKEYVVIDVPEEGGLEMAIAAANKDLTKLRNLKLTGRINAEDFRVMRDQMTELAALNLKDVRVADDEIPSGALSRKSSLTSFVFPDKLKRIGADAFYQCDYLTGSIVLPEGLETIGSRAFLDCSNLRGNISFPSTLKVIDSQAFLRCNFTCELNLPDGLEEIGEDAFFFCSNFYGELHLPKNLKKLGKRVFGYCSKLSGDIVVPSGVTEIPAECFYCTVMGGNLSLHSGIKRIGTGAFWGAGMRGELILPSELSSISDQAFIDNDFSGTLVLPKDIMTIGDAAFGRNWRLMGKLEIPEKVISIGNHAFTECGMIEEVVFPAGLENIGTCAFSNCYGLTSIVCKGELPAHIDERTFEGVAKDNFTLEVPETAVSLYQTTAGWMEFKRIAAHHELVCRPAVACAIGSERSQELIIDSEGEWEVASKPDWCRLSQESGNTKTAITLTISEFANQNGNREGDIVFQLKGKDYTHACHVTQYGYEYAENEYVELQKATKGRNGGINIFLVGDGYNAKDIASGGYLADMRMQMENFFSVEPYATYRDYFNVTAAVALSTESGVGTVNTIRYTKFNTTYTVGSGMKCDEEELIDYILDAPAINSGNLGKTLAIVVPNSDDYAGVTHMWGDGFAIAYCPKSNYGYPLDTRGVLQHEAGGHGFGKLGDEYIYHTSFIDACNCNDCEHADAIKDAKAKGWYANLELTGKVNKVGWSHLMFDRRYSDIVDIFEGGFMHSRGVFRSERNSCMNNNIPYFSTISRESIVRRIKAYAGEEFDFEEFVRLDNKNAGPATRSLLDAGGKGGVKNMPPVITAGSPLRRRK